MAYVPFDGELEEEPQVSYVPFDGELAAPVKPSLFERAKSFFTGSSDEPEQPAPVYKSAITRDPLSQPAPGYAQQQASQYGRAVESGDQGQLNAMSQAPWAMDAVKAQGAQILKKKAERNAPAAAKPFIDKREAIDDAVDRIEMGQDANEVFTQFQTMGVSRDEIIARGNSLGGKAFAPDTRQVTVRDGARDGELTNLRSTSTSSARRAADVGLAGVGGVTTGFKMMSDALGADNKLSRGLESVGDYVDGMRSAAATGDDDEIADIMAEAQDKGVWEQVKAGAKAFGVAPASFIAQGLGTTVPAILTALLPGVRETALLRLSAMVGTGAIMGAGGVKSSIFESVTSELMDTGMTRTEAEDRARLAQDYLGKNADQIALGAALGAVASSTGVERIGLGTVRALLGKNAVDELGDLAQQGILRRTAGGVLAEAPVEFLQGGQDQLAQNLASQREGFDTPTMRGVVSSATMEALAGAGAGGATSAISGPLVANNSKAGILARAMEQGSIAPQNIANPNPNLANADAPATTAGEYDYQNAVAQRFAGAAAPVRVEAMPTTPLSPEQILSATPAITGRIDVNNPESVLASLGLDGSVDPGRVGRDSGQQGDQPGRGAGDPGLGSRGLPLGGSGGAVASAPGALADQALGDGQAPARALGFGNGLRAQTNAPEGLPNVAARASVSSPQRVAEINARFQARQAQRDNAGATGGRLPTDLRPVQDQAAVAAFDSISEAVSSVTGTPRVVLVESDGDFDGINEDGQLVVNLKGLQKPAVYVAIHESYHSLQDLAEQGDAEATRIWAPMERAIYDMIPEADKVKFAQQALGMKGNSLAEIFADPNRPGAERTLRREIGADFHARRGTDPETLAELSRREPAMFGDFAKRVIKSLSTAIKSLRGNKEGLGEFDVDPMIKDLSKAKAMWVDSMIAWQKRGGAKAAPQAGSVTELAASGRDRTYTHEVVDPRTGNVMGEYQSASAARLGRDRFDNKFGAYRYSVREKAEPKVVKAKTGADSGSSFSGREGGNPYGTAPNNLMGFRKDKPNKPFAEQKYKHVEYVRVTWPDGTSMLEAQRGLNKVNALERARRNWSGGEITAVSREAAQKEDPSLVSEVEAMMSAGPSFSGRLPDLITDDSSPPKDKPIVLVFGGTFNPVHQGHVDIAVQGREILENAGYTVKTILVSPSPQSLMRKKAGADASLLKDRTAMLKRAFAPHDNVTVTDVPSRLADANKGRASRNDMADWVQSQHPEATVVSLAGADTAVGTPPGFPSAYSVDRGHSAGYYFMVMPRDEGEEGISSSKVRKQIEGGQDPAPSVVPTEVTRYFKATKGMTREVAVDGQLYDGDAENFGTAPPPQTLPDGHPLLQDSIEKTTALMDGKEVPREELRAHIEAKALKGGVRVTGRKPIAYIMGGGGAAGKGTLKAALIDSGVIQADGAIDIDTDEFKLEIPEYKQILAAGDSRAADRVHKESVLLTNRITEKAIAGGTDLIIDRTMSSPRKGAESIAELQAAGYEVRLFGVTVDPATAVVRANKRAEATLRHVPINSLLLAHKRFAPAFEKFALLADQASLYESTDGAYEVARKEGDSVAIVDQIGYNQAVKKASEINERATTLKGIQSNAGAPEVRGTERQVQRPAGESQDGRVGLAGQDLGGDALPRGQGRDGQAGSREEGSAPRDGDVGPPSLSARSVEPAPLYVSRPVLNAQAIRLWAASVGIRNLVPANKMHVTVAYSRDAVDATSLPETGASLSIPKGRATLMQYRAEGAVTLRIDSPELLGRHKELVDAGVPWQRGKGGAYIPHITLSYKLRGDDVGTGGPALIEGRVLPMAVEFGPEVAAELSPGWRKTVEEPSLSRRVDEDKLVKSRQQDGRRIVDPIARKLDLTPEQRDSTALDLMTGLAKSEAFAVRPVGDLTATVQFLEDRRLASGLPTLDINTEAGRIELANLMTAEALAAIGASGNALEWYDKTISTMLSRLALKFPELNTDPRARTAMLLNIAITSQGQNVETNLATAMRLYPTYQATGRFAVDGYGQSKTQMEQNFTFLNKLLDDMGPDMLARFLKTPFIVGELKAIGFKIGGELIDEKVLGSLVLGPKIGFGFFSNLAGNFEPVTMDMWFMRLVGRLTGKLKSFDAKKFKKQTNDFMAALGQDGQDGIYAADLPPEMVAAAQEQVEDEDGQMGPNEDAIVALAREVDRRHEREFTKRRAEFDAGTRKKTALVFASGNIVKSMDKPRDAPASGGERRLLRDVVGKMVDNVAKAHGTRVPPASLQALVWYPEQELYKALGVKLSVTSQDYAGAALKILKAEGINEAELIAAGKSGPASSRQDDVGDVGRGNDQAGQGAGRSDALEGKERRDFLQSRAIEKIRRSEGGFVYGQGRGAGPSARLDVVGTRVKPLAEFKLAKTAKNTLAAVGVSTPTIYEIPAENAADFARAIEGSKEGNRFASSVYVYPVDDYGSMRLFVAAGDKAGFALKGDDIVSVFNYDPANKAAVHAMLPLAIQLGGKRLDAFDTVLPSLYGMHGMKAVARTSWNDDYAPEGWVKEDYALFAGGEPDVVFMAHDPQNFAQYNDEGQKVDDYDAAVQIQADAVKEFSLSGRAPETPAFKKWFGDSKVVDADGKPMVVYHGTNAAFASFNPSRSGYYGSGIYLHTNRELVADYGQTTLELYVSIKNPYRYTERTDRDGDDSNSAMLREVLGRDGDALVKRLAQTDNAEGVRDELRLALEAKGYDGIIVENDSYGQEIIAFRPEQIKSATSNNGNFDPTNPDISQSRRSGTGWRDAQGRFQVKPTAWFHTKSAPVINAVLAKIGLNPIDPILKRQIRRMQQDIEKSKVVAVRVAAETFKMSDSDRQMVSDLIESEITAATVPPIHAVRMAAGIQAIMDQQTNDLIAVDMLSQESADRWRGAYLPRFYQSKMRQAITEPWQWLVKQVNARPGVMKGIGGKSLKGRGLWETVPQEDVPDYEALGWELRDPAFEKALNGPNFDGSEWPTVQVWRDFTRAEREKMGEIRDAGFRFTMGYLRTQKDIALGRMFAGIAANAELASRNEKPGWVQVPDGSLEGTGGVKRYGKLAGMWVTRDTMNHLANHDQGNSEAMRVYRKALSMWKEGKTVLNPVSHANNIMSNISMAHFAGVSYWDSHKYAGAILDFARKNPMVQEARDAGLFLGTMTQEELLSTMPKELQALAAIEASKTERTADFVWNVLSLWLRKPAGMAYEAEDMYFRYVIYRDARGNGLNPEEALEYSQRYIFTYDDLPTTARAIRDFGLPFFAYTYKVIPALLHTATHYPHRLLAPAAVMMSLNAAMYGMAAGEDDEDWREKLMKYINDPARRAKADAMEESERELLPKWMKGSAMIGAPKSVRLGTDELTGMPIFWDIGQIVPGGQMFDLQNNMGGLPWMQSMMPSHPLLTTFMGIMANKDMFTGKEVTDIGDDSAEAAAKRAAWIWKQMTPAIALGNYHSERLANVIAQMTGEPVTWFPNDATGVGRDGVPIDPATIALQTVGIKARPLDMDRAAEFANFDRDKMIRQIDAEINSMRKQNQRGSLSDANFEAAKEKAQVKKERLREGLTIDGNKKP